MNNLLLIKLKLPLLYLASCGYQDVNMVLFKLMRLIRMNTFHYLKVKFESLDIIAIEENLSSVNVSQRPCYVDASSINLEQLMELINNLATVFKYLNLHPKFPYPFYIITKLIENHETFPIVASENDLPTHFLQTAKRLTPRESMLQG